MMKWRDVLKIAMGAVVGFFAVELIKHYTRPVWGRWE